MTAPVDEAAGCRAGATTGASLLLAALTVGGAGLWLVTQRGTGLALFYAAAPFSALFGVLGGGLPVAWPLDLAIWVVAGVVLGSMAVRRGRPWWHLALVAGAVAAVYGLIMASFVEIDRLSR